MWSILKIKDFIIASIIRVFNCLPIRNNKIFLYSYYGSQYGCSPKYISEYIVKNYPDKYDVVWAFNNIESKKDIEGIRKVKIMSLKYFYELCTSKIVITNFRTTEMFKKRKNQYYVQTWHSSLRLKQIEKDAEDTLPKHYVEMAKVDSKKLDLLMSGCKFSTDIFKRAFWYDGEIFECGTPRNDILFKNDMSLNNKIKEKLKIDKRKKVILYAPTFRKNNDLNAYITGYSDSIIKNDIKISKGVYKGGSAFLTKISTRVCDLVAERNNNKSFVDIGEKAKYTIKLRNNGPDIAKNVVVTDTLQRGLIVKGVKASKGAVHQIGSELVWRIDKVSPDEELSADITVRVSVKDKVLSSDLRIDIDENTDNYRSGVYERNMYRYLI